MARCCTPRPRATGPWTPSTRRCARRSCRTTPRSPSSTSSTTRSASSTARTAPPPSRACSSTRRRAASAGAPSARARTSSRRAGARSWTRSSTGSPWPPDSGQLHDHLPDIPALEHGDEGGRRLVEPVHDRLARLHLALGEPLPDVGAERPGAVEVVRHDEALDGEALADDEREVARPGRGRRRVVGGDRAAGDDPAERLHGRERRLEVLAAHVVEVDVDALRAEALERGLGRLLPVVEGGVEPELTHDALRLRRGAGPPHHATAAAVGGRVEQLAKIAGCRVVASAGSPEKAL